MYIYRQSRRSVDIGLTCHTHQYLLSAPVQAAAAAVATVATPVGKSPPRRPSRRVAWTYTLD